MAHVEGAITINRPVEEVFDFVADERIEPRYNTQMLRAEQISAGPIGLGTRFRAESKAMGRIAERTIWTGLKRHLEAQQTGLARA